MKTEVLRARIEPDIKLKAENILSENILSEIGMTSSDAIRLLFRQIALRRSFPVELHTPNQTTIDAMNDTDLEEADNLGAILK